MFEEMQEVIRKNLPLEVGERLRAVLNEADKTKRDLAQCALERDAHRAACVKVEAERDALKVTLSSHAALAKREADVLAREKVIEVTLAQERQKAAEARLGDVKELAALVFRNPTHVYRETASVPNPNPGSYGTVPTNKEVRKEIE